MNIHTLMPYIFLLIFLVFAIWSVVRGRRWEQYQGDAANRSKAIIEKVKEDQGRFDEALSISREQLAVTKELLSEIKSLRDDLEKKTDRLA